VCATPHGIGPDSDTGTARGRAFGSSINRTVPRSRAAPPPAPPGARRSGGSRLEGRGAPARYRTGKRFHRTRIVGTVRGPVKNAKTPVRRNAEILSHRFLTRGGGVPMGTVHKGPCNATQRRPRRLIPTRHSTVLVIRVHVTAVAFGLRCTRELCVLRSCEDPRPGSARAQSRSRRRRARTSES
jgi:hypothetical protein